MLVLELVVCVLSLMGFLFLLFSSLSIPYPQSFWDGPGAFPVVLSVILIIICLIWLFDSIKALKKARATADTAAGYKSVDEATAAEQEKRRRERRSFIVISVLTILYIMVLMPLLPFPVATFIFLMASFLLFAKGAWWKSLIISAVVSVAIYLVFAYILHLPMPH